MAKTNAGEPPSLALWLKLLVFTICVPGTVTVWLPLFVLYPTVRERPIEWNVAAEGAIALIAIGVCGYLWCALEFAFVGHGTPAPIDMPRRLVMRGPYRCVRNPMYESVLLVLLGESALFRSLRLLEYAALIAVMFHLFVVMHEEPTLRRKMGPEYEQYCQDVPRWIPRSVRRRRSDAV